MPRTSPVGIDGVSVQWIKGKDGRKVETCRVRVRDQKGSYQTKRFPVPSLKKDGTPCFPIEAKTWAEATLGAFKAGTQSAGTCDVEAMGKEYAQKLKDDGGSHAYANHVQKVCEIIAKECCRDLKSEVFYPRLRHWVTTLKANWWDSEGKAAFRRTTSLTLSNSTRNKIIRELRAVINYAIETPPKRLMASPLPKRWRFKQEEELKPLFTVAELRTMVSDKARLNIQGERKIIEDLLAEPGATVASVAEQLEVHQATIYNRLNRDQLEEDPWWLPCCLLVYTGCRAQEAMHLRWEWIDWPNNVITLKVRPEFQIKRQRERLIPLQPELRAILHPRAKPHGWIIDDERLRSNGSIKVAERTKPVQKEYSLAFRRYLTRIGMDPGDRTVHSLRHCFITLQLAMNVNFDRVMRMVGHTSHVTTLGYSKQTPLYEGEVKGWEQGVMCLRNEIRLDQAASSAPR